MHAKVVNRCAMSLETEEILRDLSQNAESVCRHYLPAGRREGSYWMVGDLQNNPGRSLFVRLTGPTSGAGAAGKFTDSATGEHGDLLDIIRERTGITRFPDLLAEARAHLGRPQPVLPDANSPRSRKSPLGTPAAASRLFAVSLPLEGSLVETYLRSRGITQAVPSAALRFHPKCWHRDEGQTKPVPRPAMIAAVTDLAGVLQGVHRTWLAPDGRDKAAVGIPRRAMGHLLGNAVRIVPADQTLVLGEGIETMLSLRACLPAMPLAACTSSAHLAAFLFPTGVSRLYIARDRDKAGEAAFAAIAERCATSGIEVIPLMPILGDFNDDLRQCSCEAMVANLARQLDQPLQMLADLVGLERAARLRQPQRQEVLHHQHRGEGFGRGHANFRAGMQVERTRVGQARGLRANRIHNCGALHALRASFFHPAMQIYLDNEASSAPDSPFARAATTIRASA